MKSLYGMHFVLETVTIPRKIASSEESRANFTIFPYFFLSVLNQRGITRTGKVLHVLVTF